MIEEPSVLRRPIDSKEWCHILKTLSQAVHSLDSQKMRIARKVSLSIAEAILELDHFMEILCAGTCPLCNDICCHARNVFYNEVDLLFLVVYGKFYPPSQTRSSPDQKFCFYWRQNRGCIIHRLYRPYVCTWFICDKQSMLLEETFSNKDKRRFVGLYDRIRHFRLRLVSFIPQFYSKNI